MRKKVVISEEQYNSLLEGGITIAADMGAANGDVKKAVDTANQEASKQGLKDYNISVPGSNGTSESKTKLFSKKDLIENRLKYLKRNSTVYNFSDFIKK